jgi:hypothetical protein
MAVSCVFFRRTIISVIGFFVKGTHVLLLANNSLCIPRCCDLLLQLQIRDSSVGIATGYGLDGGGVGVRVPVGAKSFISLRRPDRFWGPPSLLSNSYGGFSPEVKRPGREADRLPPTRAEVKKTWIYTSTPPYVLMAQYLIS